MGGYLKKFLFIILCSSFIFSDNLWEHESTGWGYDQTTQQSFYMFIDMQIIHPDGTPIIGVGDGSNIEQSLNDTDSMCGLTDECDVVGAFLIHTEERDQYGNLTGTPMTHETCQEIEGTTLWSDDGLFRTHYLALM